MRVCVDAEAVVGAFADEPEYALLSVGEDELCTFLKYILLAVGEIIADELHAGHAERDEAIALLYVAQREWELNIRCIKTSTIGSATRLITVTAFFCLYLQLQAVAKHVCTSFGYVHGADSVSGCFGLEDERAAIECEFVRIGNYDFACRASVERGVYLLDLRRREATGAEYFVQGVLG